MMKPIPGNIIILLLCSYISAYGAGNTEAIIKSIIEGNNPEAKAPVVENDKATNGKNLPGKEQTKPLTEKKEKAETAPKAGSADEVLLKTGIRLYDANLTNAALAKFNELRTRFPQSPFRDQAGIFIGKIYFEQNKLEEAQREFSLIKEDSGEYPAALYSIGETHYKSGNMSGAIESFYKVTSQFPEHERADKALLFLGKIYLNEKRGNEALDAVVKIIRYYPGRETIDDAYYLLGKIYEKDPTLKDIEIARKIYRLFLKKANEEKLPRFKDSPLIKRVEKDLLYIESTYFKMEN